MALVRGLDRKPIVRFRLQGAKRRTADLRRALEHVKTMLSGKAFQFVFAGNWFAGDVRLNFRTRSLAKHDRSADGTCHFFHAEKKIHLGPHQAFFAEAGCSAEQDFAKVQHQPERRLPDGLQRPIGRERGGDLLRDTGSFPPKREITIAEIFVDDAAVFLDDLARIPHPFPHRHGQILRTEALAQLREFLNVRDKQPAAFRLDARHGRNRRHPKRL